MIQLMLSMIMVIVYTVIPIFFLISIWNNRSVDLPKWVISTLASAGYIICLFFIGGWPMIITGFYMRYVLIIALPIFIIKSYFNQKRFFPKFTNGYIVRLIGTGVVSLIPTSIILGVVFSSTQIPKSINIDFPLKNGEYCVIHGGNNLFMNHHREVDAQKYALDIVKLNRFGFRSKIFSGSALKDYNIYGDIIYSPCEGKVIKLVDEYPDLDLNKMDPEHPAGNYLAIEMGTSQMTILLAHVQKDSFLVKEGDLVRQGQPLCKVGNSGNTSEPHLHIHVVKSGGDLLFEGEGVPMTFNNRFLVRNDRITSGTQKEK